MSVRQLVQQVLEGGSSGDPEVNGQLVQAVIDALLGGCGQGDECFVVLRATLQRTPMLLGQRWRWLLPRLLALTWRDCVRASETVALVVSLLHSQPVLWEALDPLCAAACQLAPQLAQSPAAHFLDYALCFSSRSAAVAAAIALLNPLCAHRVPLKHRHPLHRHLSFYSQSATPELSRVHLYIPPLSVPELPRIQFPSSSNTPHNSISHFPSSHSPSDAIYALESLLNESITKPVVHSVTNSIESVRKPTLSSVTKSITKPVVHSVTNSIESVELIESVESVESVTLLQPLTTLLKAFTKSPFNTSSYPNLSYSLVNSLTHLLNSPVRPIRSTVSKLLALQCQPLFPHENTRVILDYLHSSPPSETTLQCWGLIARVADTETLHSALAALLDAFAHQNSFLRAAAFQFLLLAAHHRKLTPWRLLAPYWPALSINIVRHSRCRPQVIRAVADLLALSPHDFFILTKSFTLPHLVYHKDTEIIADIAAAAKKDIPNLLFENIPQILAFLLVNAKDTNPMSFLAAASMHFTKIEFPSLVRSEAISTTVEILKLGPQDIETPLSLLASAVCPSDTLIPFFKQHILGIIAVISDAINDVRGYKPASEKLACVAAIGTLIALVGPVTSIAMPQILASLQSALANDLLAQEALNVWLTLVKNLPHHQVPDLAPTIISVLLQFVKKTNLHDTQVADIVDCLFKSFFDTLSSIAPSLPSLKDTKLAHLDIFPQNTATPRSLLLQLAARCAHENVSVCTQSLEELRSLVTLHQHWIHTLILPEKCDDLVPLLLRQLLDTAARGVSQKVRDLCADCLGVVGPVDPNRLDLQNPTQDLVVLSNFEDPNQCLSFVLTLLDSHLVPAFRASLNTKSQGFLAYSMQELVKFCGFPRKSKTSPLNPRMANHWNSLSKAAKETLQPLLSSKYFLASQQPPPPLYPLFPKTKAFGDWVQSWTLALCHSVSGENAKKIFAACLPSIKDQDLSIPAFLLPFLTLNVLITGSPVDRKNIVDEILHVLHHPKSSPFEAEKAKLANQVVFTVIDYANKWLRARRKANVESKVLSAKKANRYLDADDDLEQDPAISPVESLLAAIPADLMARASFECGAHARALYYWESHFRNNPPEMSLYKHIQDIYALIDEPDAVGGISVKFPLDAHTQALEHEVAGRWSSALACYELAIHTNPQDQEPHLRLLRCLKHQGHYSSLIRLVDTLIDQFPTGADDFSRIGIEAAWTTQDWSSLARFLQNLQQPTFETEIGRAFLLLQQGNAERFKECLAAISSTTINTLARSGSTAYRENYPLLVQLGILQEIEVITSAKDKHSLEHRLLITAPSPALRQLILAARKTASSLGEHSPSDIAAVCLDSAKVARKAGQTELAYSSIIQSTKLDYPPAILEEARWWWHQGHHRRAIQNLQKAFASNAFSNSQMAAKATLLLARWLEVSGQSSSADIEAKYKEAAKLTERWEKAHFSLGRHYCRSYDSETSQHPDKQSDAFLQGELVRLICLNYGRALTFGCKYIYQTMPRLLTLWLDFGASVDSVAATLTKEYQQQLVPVRRQKLKEINGIVKKYFGRVPPYLFLTAFPQMISRICHSNSAVYQILENAIVVTASAYPHHSLWSMMATSKSASKTRSERGNAILAKLRDTHQHLVNQAQRITDQLLLLCNHDIPGRRTTLSLAKDLHFSPSCCPCKLVIPLQSFLTLTLPPSLKDHDLKDHNPFSGSQPHILSFLDEVDVMNSLQKPRKVTILGSDGCEYPFLCKPKDDLRKDARLMEFNGVIIKLLKKDIETAKRRLDIRTYAVVPLNEECGLIEWVNHTRPLRDIYLKSYKHKNIPYTQVRTILETALSHPTPAHVFTTTLLPKFPPVLYEWFIEEFSEPALWLESRNTYARSMAVMSIVGYVLGLGDRHGENILLDETTGRVVHVDFNCLFEKGLTLQTPERVPFRLTHNMVDALGITGVEGVFRNACEATMKLLRSNQDALLSVLETFIHDPLLEWSKRRVHDVLPPSNNQKRLDTTQNEQGRHALDKISEKVKGFMGGDRLPLSIQGQVDELIRQATDPDNLVRMYIG